MKYPAKRIFPRNCEIYHGNGVVTDANLQFKERRNYCNRVHGTKLPDL